MRALMAFYGVAHSQARCWPTWCCRVETEELGIAAGLQDRVAQVYQGLVYMDFDARADGEQGLRRVRAAGPARCCRRCTSPTGRTCREGSEVVHNDMRERFKRGDREVLEAMRSGRV